MYFHKADVCDGKNRNDEHSEPHKMKTKCKQKVGHWCNAVKKSDIFVWLRTSYFYRHSRAVTRVRVLARFFLKVEAH
jgi:hypothetical protein